MPGDNEHTDKEAKLHEIFDRLMRQFDQDPEADLYPRIDNLDFFIHLFRLQGRLWLHFYEVEPWSLIRFVFAGSEAAFGMETLSEKASPEAITQLVDKLSAAVAGSNVVNEEAISDSMKLVAVPLTLINRCFRVFLVCQLQYKVPIQQIISEARAGSREAFLDLVKLDSTFLLSDFGSKFLVEAELRQDHQFRLDLADVLNPDPVFWSLKGKRKPYALLTLWMLDDLAYRTDREWAEFLVQHGFHDWADPGNVRRARERYNLPKLKR